jgi:16S rRNA (guanine527-N7)-methyltransferase
MCDAGKRARRPKPLSAEEFAELADVSRETLSRLRKYAEVLTKWQRTINLVASDGLADLWRRHMLDSAQLYPLVPFGVRTVADLGSGAGFPGLVLAAMGVPEVHLIEADARKCVFLAEAARVMGLQAGRNLWIHQERIEKMSGWPADVITARACARLDRLLGCAERFLGPGSTCLFHKGAAVDRELRSALRNWTMNVEKVPSQSDPSGTVLRLSKIARGGIHRHPQ